jgi:tape measure domain-containing protein
VSDSIANLEIKVNIASVKGAMQALDGLVAKADSVEKRQTKAAEDGGKKRISAQERELRNAERIAKQNARLIKDQEKIEIQTINKIAGFRVKAFREQESGELGAIRRISAMRTREFKRQEKEMDALFRSARGRANNTTGTLGSFIDRSLGLDAASTNRRTAELAKLRRQIEQALPAATGSVRSTSGTLGSFIDRSLGIDGASLSKRERQIAQSRDQIIRAGTGQQQALRAYYTKLEETAKRGEARLQRAGGASANTLERALQGAETRFTGIQGRANRQLPNLEASRVVAQARTALSQYQDVIRQFGTGSVEGTRAQGNFARAMQMASGEIARQGGLLKTLNDNARTTAAAFGAANSSLGGFGRVIFSTSAALQALAGAFALREITQSIMEFERFTNTLRTVSGTTGQFQQNLSFLFAEANRIGFSVGEVGNSFARLSLAMQGAGFTGEQTRTTFTQLAEASRNFGLTSADTMGVIRALEQSMSKGKFMAEEVRLQMGDRLPIAMAALTRAVEKVDGAQTDINKRFEEGTLDVARYAEEFVRQINLMSGGAETLARTASSVAAAFGRLGTEFTQTTALLGEEGFSNAVIIAAGSLSELFRVSRESGAIAGLGAAFEVAARNIDLFVGAVAALGSLAAVRLMIGLFTVASPLMLTLAAAFGTLGAAIVYFNRNSSDAMRGLGSTLNSIQTELDRTNGRLENVNEMIRRGVPDTSAAATEIDRMAASYVRLGLTAEEAMRRVAIAEVTRARASVTEQQRALESAQSEYINIIDRTGNSGRLRGLASGTTTAARLARQHDRTGAPEGMLPIEIQAGQLRQVVGIIEEVETRTIPLERGLQRIMAIFDDGQMPHAVDEIVRGFNALLADPAFQALDLRLVNAQAEIARLTSMIEDLQRVAANGVNFRFQMENLQNPDGVGGAGLVRQGAGGGLGAADTALAEAIRGAGSPRTRLAAIRSAASRPDLAGLFEGVDLSGRDTDVLARLRGNRRFGVLTESVGALNDAAPNARGRGGNGPQNAVTEFMQDLRRQTVSAGFPTGAAREYANALLGLEDAATRSGRAISVTNQEAEVHRLVTLRLDRELSQFINTLNEESDTHLQVARGYAESTAAGRDAEIVTRAQTEALKYAEAGTDRYTEKVNELTVAFRRNAAADRTRAANQQAAQNNDEIAVLELERTLVTATVEQREIEIALLRARQQYGDQFTPQLEESIRALGVARSRTEQVRNSWDELARSGERAFETIGDAITEAFAKGEISSIRFGDIARAVMSSVAQTALRMAVVNPILNGIFGGTRATLGGLVDAAGGGGGEGGGGMGFLGSIGQLSGLSNLLPGGGFSGIGASINSWGASAFPSIFSSGAPASIATAGGVSMPGAASAGSLFGGTTLMGALGGVGGGFALGSLLGGMVAGNSPARKTNSMIGSGAGALAGVGLAAAFGGPVGLLAAGLIGGAGGGLLGGLIGPKKGFSGGDAILGTDDSGKLFVDRGVGKKFDTQGLVNQVTPEVARVNTIMEQAGLRFATGLFAAVGGGESGNPKTVEEALAHWGGLSGITSGNARVQTALNTVRPESFENLIAVAQEAVALSDVLDNLGKPSSEFNDAMKQLNANFDEYTRQAQRLGFGEAEIAAERKKQIDLMYSERQLRLQTISDEIKIRGWRLEGKDAMADELEASINRAQQIKALTQELEQMGYTAEQIAPFVENYGNLIDRETKRVFSDLQNNIKDFLEGLRTSDLGGYSAPDRLASARQFYDRDLAAARGGDKGALEGLTGRAETLLNAARDNFASSFQWKAVRDYIQSTLGELSITKFAKGGIPDVVSEPHIASMAMFGEAGREAIVPLRRMSNGDLGVAMGGGNMQAVVAEIRGLREDNIALRQEVASMKKELVKTTLRTAEATEDTADSNRRMVTQAPRERVGARA